MYRSSAKRLSALIVSVAAGWLLAPASALFGANTIEQKSAPRFKSSMPLKVGVSRPLREMSLPRPRPGAIRREIKHPLRPGAPTTPGAPVHDPVMQTRPGGGGMPGPFVSFEGVGDVNFVQPADTNAAVGPNNVFQWVNLAFEIWDKDGNDLTGGPVNGNAFFTGFGGPCETTNDGDVIILYDQLADRWFGQQLSYSTGSYHNCMVVSTSGDPLGSYYLYDYLYSNSALNDYPKFSVWPDAYYQTVREFSSSFTMTVTAFDRAAMLNGDPASAVFVSLDNPNFDGLLPAILYGSNGVGGGGATPRGVTPPNILMGIGNPASDGSPTSRIHIYYFHPDFGDPGSSTFTGPVDIDVESFNYVPQFSQVPQPDGGGGLEANGWIQYQLPYR